MEYVWVITGVSESCDHYGPFVFVNEPTEEEKKKLIRSECDWYCDNNCEDGCESCDDGSGDYGSYTHLTVKQVKIRRN